MDADQRSDNLRNATANPGWGFLVCVAWYALVIAAFLEFLARQPDVSASDCAGTECSTDRYGWFMFGMFIGAPAVFVAFVVSLAIMGLLAARSRIRSAVLLGTVAAFPALLLLCAVLGLAQTL
jgi:quinol-cytochrome oxidoreductase complex cytochrome b subunit